VEDSAAVAEWARFFAKFGFASSEFFFSSFVLNGYLRAAVVPPGAAMGLAPTRWEVFPQHPDEKNNGDVLPKGVCAYEELQADYDTFECVAAPLVRPALLPRRCPAAAPL
jgi:hypothetical protein